MAAATEAAAATVEAPPVTASPASSALIQRVASVVCVYLCSKFLVRLLSALGLVAARHHVRTTAAAFLVIYALVEIRVRRAASAQTDRVFAGALFPSLDEAVAEAVARIEAIRASCGALCGDEDVGNPAVDCPALFSGHVHDVPGPLYASQVPRLVPQSVLDAFTYGRKVKLRTKYMAFDLEPASDWSADAIQADVRSIKEDRLEDVSHDARERLAAVVEMLRSRGVDLAGKRVLVAGDTDTPWAEKAVLSLGAAAVVSLDRRGIQCNHTAIHIVHPASLGKYYSKNESGTFDFVVASSLAGLGMGRMGEGLHPWADVVQVARAWCVASDRADMLLVIPAAGEDGVTFNSHREYGTYLRRRLVAKWTVNSEAVLEDKGGKSAIFLLTKKAAAFAKT